MKRKAVHVQAPKGKLINKIFLRGIYIYIVFRFTTKYHNSLFHPYIIPIRRFCQYGCHPKIGVKSNSGGILHDSS
jgi:hypothetical protein